MDLFFKVGLHFQPHWFFTWPGVLKQKVWKIFWKFFLLTIPSEFWHNKRALVLYQQTLIFCLYVKPTLFWIILRVLKNCCNITNILTLNDYCNLTSVPKFSFGGYFSSLTMARPMTMFKVIKINNSWNLGHCKGTAPLLLIMQMCDDQGSNKASCKIIHAQVANHFCTQSSTRMITLYYYAKKLWYMSFFHLHKWLLMSPRLQDWD